MPAENRELVTLRERVSWPETLDRLQCAGIATVIIQTVEEKSLPRPKARDVGAARGPTCSSDSGYEDTFDDGTFDLAIAVERDLAVLRQIKQHGSWRRRPRSAAGMTPRFTT